MEINKDSFIQEFYPVRCYTCGELVGALIETVKGNSLAIHKELIKQHMLENDTITSDEKDEYFSLAVKITLDDLGITSLCTRRSIMTPIRIAYNNVESELENKLRIVDFEEDQEIFEFKEDVKKVKLKGLKLRTVSENKTRGKSLIKTSRKLKETPLDYNRLDNNITRATVVGIPIVNDNTPVISENKGYSNTYKFREITYFCG